MCSTLYLCGFVSSHVHLNQFFYLSMKTPGGVTSHFLRAFQVSNKAYACIYDLAMSARDKHGTGITWWPHHCQAHLTATLPGGLVAVCVEALLDVTATGPTDGVPPPAPRAWLVHPARAKYHNVIFKNPPEPSH